MRRFGSNAFAERIGPPLHRDSTQGPSVSGLSEKLKKARYLSRVGASRAIVRAQGRSAAGYIGCHGMANLGDDAMRQAAQRLLGSSLTVSDYCPNSYERRLEQAGLGAARSLRGIVLGGGTLINPGWLNQIERAQTQGIEIVTLGTGIGSCGFEQSEADLQQVQDDGWRSRLMMMPMVGLRGPLSLAKAHSLGIDHAQVIGDLALAMTPQALPSMDRPRSALVNLSLPKDDGEEELTQAADSIAFTAKLLTDMGWEIRWVAMTPRDVTDIRAMQSKHGVPGLIEQPATAEAFFVIARSCRASLSIRLHTAVLAACSGTPPLLVKYRDKCLDFMSSIDLENRCLSPKEMHASNLSQRIDAEAFEQIGRASYERCAGYRDALTDYAERVVRRWL